MRALTWHGTRDVRVETVPDPTIQEPTDAIIRITSSGLCGSDLHLYEVLGPFITPGDILGHEPVGGGAGVGSAGADGGGGSGGLRGAARRRRGSGCDPVQHLVRPLLDVRPRSPVAVRDHPG